MDPDGHQPSVRVLVLDARGRPVAAPGLARWLTRLAPAGARGLVSIAIVSDARVQRLNERFRGVNEPTDVLSFPNSEPRVRGLEPRVLGDIVIARGVARRQAREAGHSEQTEWRVLALHGLLHLIGYDHEHDGGRMWQVERRLRRKGGLREGLIDRAARRRNRHR
jgi:probable rRNA maturation factor